MDESQKREAARERKARERLGFENFRCATCGENDPRCLELHHIAGQKFCDDVVPVCRNCHRKLSDDQKDHPQPIGGDPDWLERVGRFLLGLADFLLLIAKTLKQFGQTMIDKARALATTGSHP